MRIAVESVPSLSAAPLVVAAVTQPFDRTASDLELPEGTAEALVAEARRVGFDGALGSTVTVSARGTWVALVGAGPSPRPTDYRRVGSAVVRLAQQLKVERATLVGANSADRARFVTEGAYLTGYQFDAYKARRKEEERAPRFGGLAIVCPGNEAAGVERGIALAESVCVARDLANEHPGRCTPSFLADQAREIAERHSFQCTIKDEQTLEREGFRLLLAVGRGSAEPSRLIHLIYRAPGAIRRKICLVGKGVTYDSGGYSLKVGDSQLNMHLDMGGAAAVLGAAEAVGRTRPEGVEVHFIVPTVENLVSGSAFKLNEIVRGYGGTTVEVLNTDAEGRLILADALAYALEQEPDEVVDLATLTGACVVALGVESAGVFASDDGVAERLIGAANDVDESVWRMPLTPRIEEHLDSEVADVKNIGSRWGGAISAAHFLKKFVGETAWAHVDIAGPAMMDKPWEYICRGGTGFGVLALEEYVRRSGA